MLDKLTVDDFSSCLNHSFRVHVDDNTTLELELVEAKRLTGSAATGKDARAPFSLLFRGPGDVSIEQRIFKVEHESLGALEIFLVPLGPDDQGTRFEAVFS